MALLAAVAAAPIPARGQAVRGGAAADVTAPTDTAAVRREARRLQARFERRRIRWLPRTSRRVGYECDEHVGRFCTWYDEGEWVPRPEAAEIRELRSDLVRALDSLAAEAPSDGWVLGQRVWYRVEGGDAEGAVAVARACAGVASWWCAALRGFALHVGGHYVEAETAFDQALDDLKRVDPERARRWRRPLRAVDGRARDLLSDVEDPRAVGVLERLWTLADPLFLVPGNDRLTEHYARWTVATLRERTRTAFRISWGRDLEELTVRHGWELGWEVERPWDATGEPQVVGHKHPEGRDFLPPGRVLEDPAAAAARDLVADRTRPRSLYAPPYAPLFLPMEPQVAVFPRGDRFRLVVGRYLPQDTTAHARHGHPRPWLDPSDARGRPDRAGAFLVPMDGGDTVRTVRDGEGGGVLELSAPTGAYLLSVEVWSPSRRRAGRLRRGLRVDQVPEGVPVLSDLLLVDPPAGGDGEEPRWSEVIEGALPRRTVEVGRPLGVAWELSGGEGSPARARYSVLLRRSGEGLAHRVGRWLRLVGDDPRVEVSWTEAAPPLGVTVLRSITLRTGTLRPGPHRLELRVSLPGREALSRTVEVEVLPRG